MSLCQRSERWQRWKRIHETKKKEKRNLLNISLGWSSHQLWLHRTEHLEHIETRTNSERGQNLKALRCTRVCVCVFPLTYNCTFVCHQRCESFHLIHRHISTVADPWNTHHHHQSCFIPVYGFFMWVKSCRQTHTQTNKMAWARSQMNKWGFSFKTAEKEERKRAAESGGRAWWTCWMSQSGGVEKPAQLMFPVFSRIK